MKRGLIFALFLISAVPVFSQDAVPTRTVTVRVIIDWDRRPPAPEERIRQAIEFTNKKFLKNREKFGGTIRFNIASIDVWRNMWPDQQDLDVVIAYHKDVKSIALNDKKGADILLVYTPKGLKYQTWREIDNGFEPDWDELFGVTDFPGESDSALIHIGDWMNLTTLHELYHLFGAIDSRYLRPKEPSIMRFVEDAIADIDEENAVIVRKNRTREF